MSSTKTAVTHKDVLAGLSAHDRARLLERCDVQGLQQLARHAGGLCLTGSWIALGLPGWWLMLVPHGVLLVFLFTALHESIHETAFATRWLNRWVSVVAGFLLVLLPRWFHAFHFAHHRHTNDPNHDPELAGRPIASRRTYLWRLTGLPVWWQHVATLLRVARGRSLETFVPKRATRKIIVEARCFLVGYILVAMASVVSGSSLVLWLWLIPALLGQPFLRAYLMAEHTLCPHVGNMLENSRTTVTHRVVRALAWNMPFHAEHHSYPNVPFHKLPLFHDHIRTHVATTTPGYRAFHREMLEAIQSGEMSER